MDPPSPTFQELLQVQIDRCSNDQYLLGRLRSFLTTILPSHIERARESRQKSTIRRTKFEREGTSFTQEFLIRNRYTFVPTTDSFFRYDGVHLAHHGEDDILHDVLTALSSRRDLAAWKHKIKISIMKKIKDRHPFSIIPESETIQRAIDAVWRPFFPSRDAAKYFMTVVGDCLIGKAESRVYILHPSLKSLLTEIMHYGYSLFGICSNAFQPLKLKYHTTHAIEDIRLIRSCNLERTTQVSSETKQIMADILYVCAHYSERYNGSDGFLGHNGNDSLAEHALFLQQRSLTDIAGEFIKNELEICTESRISKKDMKFVLRRFFEQRQIPQITSYDILHQTLVEIVPYDYEADEFIGVTSSSLPLVASFRKFWDECIIPDDESELEIGEIVTMFTRCGGKMGRNFADPSTVLMDIIKHFYPTVIFEDNKHAIGISCTKWDKTTEVLKALDKFRMRKAAEGSEYPTSIDAMYNEYSKSSTERIVGKRFFEKIAVDILEDNVDDNGCIHTTWWIE